MEKTFWIYNPDSDETWCGSLLTLVLDALRSDGAEFEARRDSSGNFVIMRRKQVANRPWRETFKSIYNTEEEAWQEFARVMYNTARYNYDGNGHFNFRIFERRQDLENFLNEGVA